VHELKVLSRVFCSKRYYAKDMPVAQSSGLGGFLS